MIHGCVLYDIETQINHNLTNTTKCVVIMTKEGSNKIVNFTTPGAGVSYAKVWPYKSYSENALFFLKKLFLYSPRYWSDKQSI